METALIYDIAAVAIIVISAIVMSKRGLVKSIYKLLSVVITVIAVVSLSEPTCDILSQFGVDARVNETVTEALIEEDDLPEFYADAVNDIKEQTVVPAVSNVVMKVLSSVLIYIVVKILLYILFLLISGIIRFPVLKQVNSLAGIAAGVVSGLVIVYLLCGIMSLDVSGLSSTRQVIDKTVIVKHFYDNNILMELFVN